VAVVSAEAVVGTRFSVSHLLVAIDVRAEARAHGGPMSAAPPADQGKDEPKQRQDPTEPEGTKTITVRIRTPAGIGHDFEVGRQDRVDQTVRTAVDYFVAHEQLAAGHHGLVVIRYRQAVEMPDTARLQDFDVVDGDVLGLINKDPQVDG
jgi:hypothetical protein